MSSGTVRTSDGLNLYYEEFGRGAETIVFVHEFGGNYWSWEPQIHYFSRSYRCITYSARGYPPSEVPADVRFYSQDRATLDLLDVLDALAGEPAHVIGLSMGGFACLHAAMRAPTKIKSLVAAGTGYGAEKQFEDYFRNVSRDVASKFETLGSDVFSKIYAEGASRVQFRDKDPQGWHVFADRLARHSSLGAANTMRGVQACRPSLYDLKGQLSAIKSPVLIMAGDEDAYCLEPGIFLKETLPRCGLVVLPKAGHTLNLEEPDMFNYVVGRFLSEVELGGWGVRDPRADPRQVMRTK